MAAALSPDRGEESPGSTGQGAGQHPVPATGRKVQQKGNRLALGQL